MPLMMASRAFNKGLDVDDPLLVYPFSYSVVQLSHIPISHVAPLCCPFICLAMTEVSLYMTLEFLTVCITPVILAMIIEKCSNFTNLQYCKFDRHVKVSKLLSKVSCPLHLR